MNQINFERDQILKVSFLDVGQGDATLVEAPNGEQILIDGGRNEKVLSELSKVMKFYDKKIDTLVISHADLDHIGGLFGVLETYNVEKILRSEVEIEPKYEEKLLKTAGRHDIEIIEISTGDVVVLDSENQIYFDVLFPPRQIENSFSRNENSLILRLIYGDFEFLFTGDATSVTENILVQKYKDNLDSYVLKVGHHGSKTSSSKIFLEKVKPKFSVISYGQNSYGHPHDVVIRNLQEIETSILETKKSGTIVFQTNGREIAVEKLFDQPSILQSLVSPFFVYGLDSFSTNFNSY